MGDSTHDSKDIWAAFQDEERGNMEKVSLGDEAAVFEAASPSQLRDDGVVGPRQHSRTRRHWTEAEMTALRKAIEVSTVKRADFDYVLARLLLPKRSDEDIDAMMKSAGFLAHYKRHVERSLDQVLRKGGIELYEATQHAERRRIRVLKIKKQLERYRLEHVVE